MARSPVTCWRWSLWRSSAPSLVQAQEAAPPLIRDAEIEGLMRLYTRPIFQAAGLNPGAVQVYLINDQRINAFVAGGQRIFINTGLLHAGQDAQRGDRRAGA